MAGWDLRYVKDTLDPSDRAELDFPLLVSPSEDYSVIGLRAPGGGAGWFRANRPGDPERTDIEELDPEGLGWVAVDLQALGEIAPSVRATVVGHTRELADQSAEDGYAEAADDLRAMASALGA